MEKNKKLSKQDTDQINTMVEQWVKTMNYLQQVHLKYDFESLKEMDNYIELIRLEEEQHTYIKTRELIGYYLGKCIIEKYDGVWITKEDSWPLVMIGDNGLICNPLGKVKKQFANGSEDSIAGYFSAIGHLLEEGIENLKKRL